MELQYKQEDYARKFFYKRLLNLLWLSSKARFAKNKKEIFLVTTSRTCCKPDFCFWFVRKDKNRIKANFTLNLWEL